MRTGCAGAHERELCAVRLHHNFPPLGLGNLVSPLPQPWRVRIFRWYLGSMATWSRILTLGAVCLTACHSPGGAGAGGSTSATGSPTNAVTGVGGAGGSNPCDTGQAICGGVCTPVQNDDAHCGDCDTVCSDGQHCVGTSCVSSNIQHVVLIVEENHTFDAYFGNYCKAPAGSNPTCTAGPMCCEAAPQTEPHGASPIVLDDNSNFSTDRDHARACEVQEIDGGLMDNYVTGAMGADTCFGSGPDCSSQNNFALADETTVGPYWLLADGNALADRYFQPTIGGSASNDMYFAIAHFQFVDNTYLPNATGTPYGCLENTCVGGAPATYQGRKTIADVLLDAGKTFTIYADGYADALAAAPSCESVPSDCTYSEILHPVAAQASKFDASDIPFNYYAQFNQGAHTKDFKELANDLASNSLPSFSYVKAREFHNEHPNVSTITDGVQFVTAAIASIESSPYKDSTLVLLTWDEGGGFYDHVAPPPAIDTDDQNMPVPHGTRVPLLAIGPFARHGSVSHVFLEHSSVVRFH